MEPHRAGSQLLAHVVFHQGALGGARPSGDVRAAPRARGRHQGRRQGRDRSALLTRDILLRERVLWRMLYESASRTTAVLDLNVEDLDLDNRLARVTVKGGDTKWITWGRGTALLLPRYLKGRTRGPLFLSDRQPGAARRAAAPKRDICPETGRLRLGYDRARTLIKHDAGSTSTSCATQPPPISANAARTPPSSWPRPTTAPSAPSPATPNPA